MSTAPCPHHIAKKSYTAVYIDKESYMLAINERVADNVVHLCVDFDRVIETAHMSLVILGNDFPQTLATAHMNSDTYEKLVALDRTVPF